MLESVGLALQESWRLLRTVAVPNSGRQHQPIRVPDLLLSTFALTHFVAFLIGLLGVLIYAAAGGARYFNVRFLFLVPTISTLCGLFVFAVAAGLLYFAGEARGYNKDKKDYWRALIFCFLFSPAAYLVLPLKFFFPTWNRHFVVAGIAIALYAFTRIPKKGSPCFRKTQLFVGFVLVAIPYFTAQWFSPRMAAFVVEKLGL